MAATTYPALVASALGDAYKVLACSGANSSNLLEQTQSGASAPQLSEVSPKATVVTVLMGLNDLTSFNVIELAACETRNVGLTTPRSCGVDQTALQREVSEAEIQLSQGLAWLKYNRPGVRVIVLDYPAIVPSDSCPTEYHLTTADLGTYARALIDLNAGISYDARAAGDTLIDLYKPSIGDDGCPLWVQPGWVRSDELGNHPSKYGVQEIAATIETDLG